MTERTITLPESVYRSLVAIAQKRGMTPESWIALQISDLTEVVNSQDEKPELPPEFPSDLIGSFNSKKQSLQSRPVDEDDAFGRYLVEKMKKQGIHLP